MTRKDQKIIFVPSDDIESLNDLSGTNTLLRCRKALELWKTNKYDLIITSGGRYLNQRTQTISAADIMKRWLVSNQIDGSKILSENTSIDTYTNIHYSLKLLKDKGINIKSLTVVSHWTHLLRMKIILWRNYQIKPICMSVEYKLTFIEWLHEIIWFFYSFLDKSGYGFPEKIVRGFIRKRVIE
jgi:hypothetical protein